MKRLENKVALISGATRGIGRTAAELFVSGGASVAICGRDVKEGEKVAASINADHPHKAAFCALDVTRRESWEKAIAFAKETFGELNILINNAGTRTPFLKSLTTHGTKLSPPIRRESFTACSWE